MDKELKIHGYDLTTHKITGQRLINLSDGEGKLMLTVPMEMYAVSTVFRSIFKQEKFSIPAHIMFLKIMKTLGGKMHKTVIDELRSGRFFASIYFTDHKGKECRAKAEASDALAMAYCTPCEVFVMASVIEAAKNDRENRVYWYTPEDGEMLERVRACSHDELVALPRHELEQLLEIAAKIEDFEFATRIKKALDVLNERVEQIRKILAEATVEDPEKFVEDMTRRMQEHRRERPLWEEDDEDAEEAEDE
jgi:bifunctional DNase/RNase